MTKKIKFGECLNLLLSALNISGNKLSKSINVDSSLVSRWLHEKRVPSYRTSYIEAISECLSQNILNSFHEKRLNEILKTFCKNIDDKMNMQNKINKLLLEAQGYSLEFKKSSTPKKFSKLENSDILLKSAVNSFIPEQVDYTSFVNLSSEDKIIIGSENILSVLLSLLKNASKKEIEDNDTIYVSYNSDTYLINNPKTLILFRNTVLKLIKNGWKIVCLFKITNNFRRTIDFINFSKPLVTTGKFYIYYYNKYDTFTTGKEIVVIPDIGALSCYATNHDSQADFGFYISANAGIKLFKNYYNELICKTAKPLIRYYNGNEDFEFNSSLILNEEKIGKCFLYKENFSLLTFPIEMYEKLLNNLNLPDNQKLQSIKLFKRRLDAFLLNLEYYEHFHIYSLNAIHNLIRHKQILINTLYEVHTVKLEIQDIIILLQNIIYLLTTYDNFKIAFTNENIIDNKYKSNFNCWVKEKLFVNIETIETLKSTSKIKLLLQEPMLVDAFQLHFKEVLDSIPPINKDKEELVKWLQHQISILTTTIKI